MCSVGLASEKCLVDGSIYLCVRFEYVSFLLVCVAHLFHIRNLCSVALGLFSGGYICSGYMCIVKCMWCSWGL